MNIVSDWFRWLHDSYGINFVYFYDGFEWARVLRGMETTLELSVICIVLSVLIGIFGAWIQGAPLAIVRLPVQAYIQFFRNTPPLVQLYFFYFAVGPQLPLITSQNGFPQPLMGSFGWARCF